MAVPTREDAGEQIGAHWGTVVDVGSVGCVVGSVIAAGAVDVADVAAAADIAAVVVVGCVAVHCVAVDGRVHVGHFAAVAWKC